MRILSILFVFTLCLINVNAQTSFYNHPDTGNEKNIRIQKPQGNEELEEYFRQYSKNHNSLKTFNDDAWNDIFTVPGVVDGPIFSMATDGINLYVGGQFTVAGGTVANNIAMWDGEKWHSLESGVNGTVQTLCYYNNKVYAGGAFTSAGNLNVSSIACWNGTEWEKVGGDSLNGLYNVLIDFGGDTVIQGPFIYALSGYENSIVIGGFFNRAGGSRSNGIAAWNLTEEKWDTLAGGLANEFEDDPPYAYAFAIYDSLLYAGGKFIYAGSTPARGLAVWNGSEWNEVGGGVNNWIRDMETDTAGNLYAVGMFDSVGSIAASGVAKWDGNEWTSMESGIQPLGATLPDVRALEFYNNELYVAGYFSSAGDAEAFSIAKWNGSEWSSPGKGIGYGYFTFPGTITSLETAGNKLYTGGYFTRADSILLSAISVWDDSGWDKLSDGSDEKGIFDGSVLTAFATEDALYAGGDFNIAGGVLARGIAKWTPAGWEPLGTGNENGVNGTVYDILVDGNDVFVGGLFSLAGTDTAYSIARWNGTEWSSIGIGVGGVINASVNALYKHGDYLYAGGYFAVVGDDENFALPAYSAARFNLITERWEALGEGLQLFEDFPGIVHALEMDNDILFAGGSFFLADTLLVNNLAVWDGGSWSRLGGEGDDGVTGEVHAMKVIESELYIGGLFSRTGEGNTESLVKWDGDKWSEVNGGITGHVDQPSVNDIKLYNNNIIISGLFSSAGTTETSNIAMWNGSSWNSLGSGTNDRVMSISVADNMLYAGGAFTIAGSKPSVSVGQYDLSITSVDELNPSGPTAFMLYQNYPNPFNPSTSIEFTIPFGRLVQLKIYDVLGREAATVINKEMPAGTHIINFDAGSLASGVYFYSLKAGEFSLTMKMLLLK